MVNSPGACPGNQWQFKSQPQRGLGQWPRNERVRFPALFQSFLRETDLFLGAKETVSKLQKVRGSKLPRTRAVASYRNPSAFPATFIWSAEARFRFGIRQLAAEILSFETVSKAPSY